ncbi:MAG: malto-oligosyltrehalose synthase [Trueperaceae bacterium]
MPPELHATYRLQLRNGIGFEEATELVGYLAELGISHLYASPYLQATEGSTHGYDIVDPTRVDEGLGGAAAHERMCRALLDAGLGQVIDVVPNHMAIAGRQNPWWWDVLENGPSSRYASYFDVDWEASEERWPNKVLLPVLGDHYGRVLEDGQLQVAHTDGAFVLRYHDHVFPLDPSSVAGLLAGVAELRGSSHLAFLAERHAGLPRPTVTARQAVERRHRDQAVLAELLARLCREEPTIAAAIDAAVVRLNGDHDALDALLEQQNYRLALWRTASRDLGYRRFFDIKDLAGLRVEEPEVFAATHALPIAWVERGWVHGLRIDHPDGLRDPGAYFVRLREACPAAWVVAEKILEPGERLPADWPIAGTTGYDFLNLVGGLFVDARGEGALTRLHESIVGQESDFAELARASKWQVLDELLGSEVNRLVSLFVAVCERHRRHRDYTRRELRVALSETAVHFPVYRSYVSAATGAVGETDVRHVDEAIAAATAATPDLDPELFGFLRDLLLLRHPGSLEGELAMRFQQLTGPAMAKGLEDTAFYRDQRLIALNEVGGDPERFGIDPARFHDDCVRAQAEHPTRMLATSTHDTKRSEDVRARLALLSEVPQRWSEAVRRWREHARRHRRGELPDRPTEYLLYQTLVGAWPIDAERVSEFLEKAVREAKLHTSWTAPDEAYERAVVDFARALLGDEAFRADLEAFVADLVHPGRINGLAQTLIKLTAPGVPDVYQGTELWDLSLVDPDNRRPVDFDLRRRLLAELTGLSPEDIVARMDEGLPKMWLLRQALRARRLRPRSFGGDGGYRPLPARGAKADHLLAFARGDDVVVVAPRLVTGLADGWQDTVLELPAGAWRDLMTGDAWPAGAVPVAELLGRFPVALLVEGEVASWR